MGKGGERGPSEEVSLWDCCMSPGHHRECLGRLHLTRQRHAEGLTVTPAPVSFPPQFVDPEGPGEQGGRTSRHSLAPCPPVPGEKPANPRQSHPGEPSLAGGFGEREQDAVLLHCGTYPGFDSTCPSILASPAPLCKEMEKKGGDVEQDMSPALLHPTLPSVLMIWFNPFCFLS